MMSENAGLSTNDRPITLAGLDGCRGGWVAVHARLDAGQAIGDCSQFAYLSFFEDIGIAAAALGPAAIVAIDMPIGLPDFIRGPGRGPEQAVRPLLGGRQSSVFSIPSRRAVHAADYRTACDEALATSHPPKKVSKQAFNLFPRIRELDRFLRALPQSPVAGPFRIHECHPEVAFAMLNGKRPLENPKKVKSRLHQPGADERRTLLRKAGFHDVFLDPDATALRRHGAALDDFLDACACFAVACRIASGTAEPHPRDYQLDSHGLPIAIWA